MPSGEDTPLNGNATEQPPDEPLLPVVETSEQNLDSGKKAKGTSVEKCNQNPEHWTRYAEAVCAILLVGITFSYTIYACRQASNSTLAIEADRPWIGVHMRGGELVEGNPAVLQIVATNSGRRPAKLLRFISAVGYYEIFPENPEYRKPTRPPSIGIMVPGDTSTGKIPLTADFVHDVLLNSIKFPAHQFFLYTEVQYADVVSGKLHVTHACWVYEPGSEMGDPAGFELCNFYNEAQ